MKNLDLHVTFFYFDQIEAGTKTEEFRDFERWRKKIEGKTFDTVTIWRAYMSRKDKAPIVFPWTGYEVRNITHPHFKNIPTKVFAIKLEKP